MMLRNLLIERFKLETHGEKQPMPVFALTVGKRNPKLLPSAANDEQPSCKVQTPAQRKDGQLPRTVSCRKQSMDDLANRLPKIAAAYIDRPVIDLTGLKGLYDFTLEWTPRRGVRGPVSPGGDASAKPGEVPTASESNAVTIFDALQSQLGLRLELRKHPMDILVIDKVERLPIDN
jgi:uncharacterized protein (TIGR03435 family)